MRCVAAAAFFLAILPAARVSSAEEMPRITGQTLTNKQVDFPSACAGSTCIIVIGFSHGARSQVKGWTDRANTDFRNDPNVVVYSMAVLEDAPRLVRGMAVHGMKSDVPEGERNHIVVVYQGEAALKRVAGFRKKR
jgi:hypothetical protein